MDFDELADGFQQLENNFEDIANYANDIVSDSEYNDARTWRDSARDCISRIEDILDPMPEEEPVKKTAAKKTANNEGNE